MKYTASLIKLFTLLSLSFTHSPIFAQSFISEHTQVSLIELYTSEGCSSCPPADKWLNSLKEAPGLWSTFIPIAFHVDYWDYIGWKDPFAQSQYTQRQRQYNLQNNLSSIYTPAMILNGQEWTSWYSDDTVKPLSPIAAGRLSIELNDKLISAQYQALTSRSLKLILNIAIVGFNLNTDVKQGENRGRILKHDFVVLSYQQRVMTLSRDGDYISSSTPLPSMTFPAKTTALIAWVNTEKDLSPLQATGGWIH